MSDHNKPLVSICIPTYNGEKFIAEALHSVLNQDYDNLEIILSDDRSSDNTVQFAKAILSKSGLKHHIDSHEPSGIGANWNNTIKLASGAYIKFLFQDDVLKPNCISEMVKAAENFPDAGLIYSRRDYLIEDPESVSEEFISYYGELHTHWQDLKIESGCLAGREYLKDSAFLNSPKNKIGEPTNVLIKTDVFKKVGYFNESMKQALDSDFWYRLMPFYNVVFIDKILVKFRLHEDQTSAINKQNREQDQELIYKEYYKHLLPYLHPKNKRKLLKRYHPFYKALVSIKRTIYGQK